MSEKKKGYSIYIMPDLHERVMQALRLRNALLQKDDKFNNAVIEALEDWEERERMQTRS